MTNALTLSERIEKNNFYYNLFASDVAKRTENRDYSRAYQAFLVDLPQEGAVLDVGCGTGLHLAHFSRLGLQVLGVEPCAGMRNIVVSSGLPVIEGTFETIDTIRLPRISGIWCAASLLHVPEIQIDHVFSKLATLLPRDGNLFFTVRLGEGAKWDRFDDEGGKAERFIQLFSETKLEDALQRVSLRTVEKWIEDSTWGRPSRWISIVAKR